MSDEMLRHHISRVYELCIKLWPEEFQQKYAESRSAFNQWINEKTGLSEDPSKDKLKAIQGWMDVLEDLVKKKG